MRSSSNSVTLLSRLFVPGAPPADASVGGMCSFGGMGRDLGGEATTAVAPSAGGGGGWRLSFRPCCPASCNSGSITGRGFSLVDSEDRCGSVGFAGSNFDNLLRGDAFTVFRFEEGGDMATPMFSGLEFARLYAGGGGA